MCENNKFYSVSNHGDRLKPGDEIKIEHRVYANRKDAQISDLTTVSIERLEAMRNESVSAEQAIFDSLREATKKWETQAAQTLQLDLALGYVKTRPVEHTANKWEKTDYDYQSISNMVYKMHYRVYEDTTYDRETEKSVPVAWYVTWRVYTNHPRDYYAGRGGVKIAGQDKKRFTDKVAMQKYMDGRIKVYSHLFKEISPPIPKEYAHLFHVNSQLLPGYIVAGEQPALSDRAAAVNTPKASIKEMLAVYSRQGEETQTTAPDNCQPTHDAGR